MWLNQRYLRTDKRELSPSDEMLELADILSGAPGISAVEVEGAHPRGGYSVRFYFEPKMSEAFISYLEGCSWRPVM